MEAGLGGGVGLADHVLRAKRICGLPSLTLWPYYFDTADLPHRRRTDALSLWPIPYRPQWQRGSTIQFM